MSFREAQDAARLAEEVGELAREVNHHFASPIHSAFDLDDAFAQMMAKVTARDAGRWTRKAR